VDIVFVVAASKKSTFESGISFAKRLLAGFSVSHNTTRVAIARGISFERVIKYVDYIASPPPSFHKCSLLHEDFPRIAASFDSESPISSFEVRDPDSLYIVIRIELVILI
jgi:hypothetical protein